MIAVLLLLFFLTSTVSFDFLCDRNSSSWQDIPPPKNISLPENYAAVVRFTDWVLNKTSLVKERQSPLQSHIVKEIRDGKTHYFIGKRNYVYNDSSCKAFTKLSDLQPIYAIQELIAETFHFDGFTVGKLVNATIQHKYTSETYAHNTTETGGIDSVVWVGCDNSTNTTVYQVELEFAGDHSLQSYSPTIKNPYLLSVVVAAFNATDNNRLLGRSSFDITELEALPSGEQIETDIPPGTYCSGFEEKKLNLSFADFPRFKMSFDHVDVKEKKVYDIEIQYDTRKRISSMRLRPGSANVDIPFFGKGVFPKAVEEIQVTHDFEYGLQYVHDAGNDLCLGLSAIDPGFGDVEVVNVTTNEIDLKNVARLLMLANNQFYFSEERVVGGIPVYVYTTRYNTSEKAYTVLEVLLTPEEWMIDRSSLPFLHSFIQYVKDEKDKEMSRSFTQLQKYESFSTPQVSWVSTSVFPCMDINKSGYLLVTIGSHTLEDLKKIGLMRVQEKMREEIARIANVSVLRVDNFFFKEMEKDVVTFFVISNKASATPAVTRNQSLEISLENAVKLLNDTLQKDDITVEIDDATTKHELKLQKSSLRSIPAEWAPQPPSSFNGYSGGSMFLLGFFMLILGALAGVGIVYFMWKRQRISGLAYQVFE